MAIKIALAGLKWHIGGGTSGYNFMYDSYWLDRWQKHLGKTETNYIYPAKQLGAEQLD